MEYRERDNFSSAGELGAEAATSGPAAAEPCRPQTAPAGRDDLVLEGEAVDDLARVDVRSADITQCSMSATSLGSRPLVPGEPQQRARSAGCSAEVFQTPQ